MDIYTMSEQAYKNGYKAGVKELAEKLYKSLTTNSNWRDFKSAWLENGECYWLKHHISNIAKDLTEEK